ncbi:MAG: hypothetical protein JXA46_13050 [Dehalococcoidales bacterium]|nr:hypothetical protein [Dehalococcoidales bacterium]
MGIPNLGIVFSIITDNANLDLPFEDARVRMAMEYAIDKRLVKMKDLQKTLYNECLQVPYLQDGPGCVIDESVQDINRGGGHTNGFFDPVNIWINK